MKREVILELFGKFEQACYIYNGIECWSARELQEIFGYSKWVNFLNVIDKAKRACENAGASLSDHFADIGKMIAIAKGAKREVEEKFFIKSKALSRKSKVEFPLPDLGLETQD